ncbi:cytochrome P450 [Marmoricola endophyticus]|nr:cytochrome P450 [Marmoricola endophyticus]
MALLTRPTGGPVSSLAAPLRQPTRWVLNHALPNLMATRAARRGDLQGRLMVGSVGMTPDEVGHVADEVRASGAVHKGFFSYMTASLPVVKEVLSSNDFRTGIFDPGEGRIADLSRWAQDPEHRFGPLEPPSLLATEPPDHTRYRKLVTRVFTARAVEALRERTQAIADELVDSLDTTGPVDLVDAYCSQLPVTVIAEILGVPAGDRDRVLGFGAAAAPSLDTGLGWSSFRRVEAGLHDFDHYLEDHLEQLRRDPGDDLMSRLVAAEDDGVGLDMRELKATAGLVLAAGFETTVNLLGNAIALLRAHPDQLTVLRERPDLWANATDEALRVDPPVLLTGRLAARDTEVAGVPVRQGTLVTTMLAGANRDPDVFEDADRFDVTRENARDHVSFSSGRHYCLGAALARMEGEVGLRTLFDRYPDLELQPGARRRTTRILRGYDRLPARLGAPA